VDTAIKNMLEHPKITQLKQNVPASPVTVAQSLRPAAPAPAPAAATELEDDDDDDMPPPLEASRSVPSKPSSDVASGLQEAAAAGLGPDGLPEGEQTNEAATALMEKALAAREQKRKETEEARRKSDLASGGALKKGFLSGGKAKKRTSEKAEANPAKAKETEDIPFITGAADPEAARRESLKLPEVQRVIQQGSCSRLQQCLLALLSLPTDSLFTQGSLTAMSDDEEEEVIDPQAKALADLPRVVLRKSELREDLYNKLLVMSCAAALMEASLSFMKVS